MRFSSLDDMADEEVAKSKQVKMPKRAGGVSPNRKQVEEFMKIVPDPKDDENLLDDTGKFRFSFWETLDRISRASKSIPGLVRSGSSYDAAMAVTILEH